MSTSPPVLWEGASRPPRKWQAEALPIILDALKRGVRGVVSVTTGGGKSVELAELVRVALPKTKERGHVVVVCTPTQNLVRQLSATVARRVGPWNVGVFYADKKDANKPVIVTCNASLSTLAVLLAAAGIRVSLLIADECHSSESEQMRAAIPALNPASRVGFTATPFRSCSAQCLSEWDEVVYRYTFADALRDRVLVPFSDHIVNWAGGPDADLDQVCIDLIRQHGRGPGIVSATSIKDATRFAEKLCEAGIPAAPIHSKRTPAAQTDLLERLQRGELAALVHVSLLAEGVDLPWLRWICLRRAVGARVRFIQELGRVLRVCDAGEAWYQDDLARWGEKTHAVVIDPHDLLGTLGIAHEAAIGEALDEEAEEAEAEEEDGEELDEEGRKRKAKALRAVAVDQITAWTTRMVLELQSHGLASNRIGTLRGRNDEPSSSQVRFLRDLKRFVRYLPAAHRPVVGLLADRGAQLTAGAVSDLITILQAVKAESAESRERQRHWRWPAAIDVESLDESVVGRLEIAMSRGRAA